MPLSDQGLEFLKRKEGFAANAYADGDGTSIGYGHQLLPGENFRTVTREQAETLLRQDVAKAEVAVREGVHVPMTQAEEDALISFTYNVGTGAFKSSNLLAKFNAGDKQGAAAEFGRFVKSKGVRLAALETRRGQEQNMFLNADYSTDSDPGLMPVADRGSGGRSWLDVQNPDGSFNWGTLGKIGGIALVGYLVWNTLTDALGDFFGTLATLAIAAMAFIGFNKMMETSNAGQTSPLGLGTPIPPTTPDQGLGHQRLYRNIDYKSERDGAPVMPDVSGTSLPSGVQLSPDQQTPAGAVVIPGLPGKKPVVLDPGQGMSA